jgi:myo-inositol-1(or 4)-monophosphatase
MHPMITIASRAARAAGNIQRRYLEHLDSLTISSKGENDFVSEVDKASEQVIIETLRKAYPDHAILAEESGVSDGNEFQWIIDPLDGTTNYLHGIPQFSISIALRRKGILEHGVVFDPLRDEMFSASRGSGAMLNDRRLRVTNRKNLKGAIIGTGIPFRDRRHLDTYLAMLRDMITADTAGIRRPGSAALDFAYVAAGRLDGFWELNLSPWDFAAGALLVAEAGGTVTDLAGGDRFFDTCNVVAGGLKVHAAMLERLRSFIGPTLPA